MIDPDIPFKIASEPTHIEQTDTFAVCALGFGGVNSHCILRSPPRDLVKPLERKTYPRRRGEKAYTTPAKPVTT